MFLLCYRTSRKILGHLQIAVRLSIARQSPQARSPVSEKGSKASSKHRAKVIAKNEAKREQERLWEQARLTQQAQNAIQKNKNLSAAEAEMDKVKPVTPYVASAYIDKDEAKWLKGQESQRAWAAFRAQEREGYNAAGHPWWSKPLFYGTVIGGIVGGIVGGLLGGPAGAIGGAAVGATVGAIWGSSQEGYVRTVRDLLAQDAWKSRRPADFPSSPMHATEWLLKTMQVNANGPIGQTLRQVNQEWGPLGRLVTVPVWIKLVEGGGPWDFKKEQTKPKAEGGWEWDELTIPMKLAGLQVRRDTFANIHYGYVGRSLGFSRWFLEAGAGAAQIRANTWKWNYWNTWFDDPVDNAAIRAGMDLYEKYTAQGLEIDEQALQQVLQDYPDVLCTPECSTP